MKRLFQLASVVTVLAILLSQAAAQQRTYKFVNVGVPFKFNVGKRSFRPGQYQFLFVGTNLMVLRDARARVVASLVTRNVQTEAPALSTSVVFRHGKKNLYLAQIKFQDNSELLEILGEELAIPQPAPPPASVSQPAFSFGDRREGPRIKQ